MNCTPVFRAILLSSLSIVAFARIVCAEPQLHLLLEYQPPAAPQAASPAIATPIPKAIVIHVATCAAPTNCLDCSRKLTCEDGKDPATFNGSGGPVTTEDPPSPCVCTYPCGSGV